MKNSINIYDMGEYAYCELPDGKFIYGRNMDDVEHSIRLMEKCDSLIGRLADDYALVNNSK